MLRINLTALRIEWVTALFFLSTLVRAGVSDMDTQFPGGFTFKGANVPFGMMMWGRNSRSLGYSVTFLSGAEMPAVYSEELAIQPVSAKSKILAEPIDLGEPGFLHSQWKRVEVELTGTPRTGMGRFTFSEAEESQEFLLSLGEGTGDTHLEVLNGDHFGFQGSVIRKAHQINRVRELFFSVRIDRPIAAMSEVVENGHKFQRIRLKKVGSKSVLLKVGISWVSTESARLAIDTENPGWNFESIRDQARRSWENALSLIQVEGGTERQRRFFYTALGRIFFHPNLASDTRGHYRGFDDQIHSVQNENKESAFYYNFSGWDIYRSWMPLLAWLRPRLASDFVRTLILSGEQGGGNGMPRWPAGNTETGVMEGGSATPIVAGAYAFGARDWDIERGFAQIYKMETDPSTNCQGVITRPSLSDYLRLGFVPDSRTSRIGQQSAALTLEYAIGDFAASRLALALGKSELTHAFLSRSQNWKNLLDPSTRLIRPRKDDGTWLPDFNPDRGDMVGFTEGSAHQYTWMVPHSLHSLITQMGGPSEAERRLDTHFLKLNESADSAFFWMGNEPGFGAPWVYNWTGSPWKTQRLIRRILDQLFMEQLPGADDLGAMSSWGVWAALGLYPAIPGVGGFTLTTPLFESARIQWEGEGDLLVRARGASDHLYIKNVSLNGSPVNGPWLDLETLRLAIRESGGRAVLDFTLDQTPHPEWGSDPRYAPPSFDGMGELE